MEFNRVRKSIIVIIVIIIEIFSSSSHSEEYSFPLPPSIPTIGPNVSDVRQVIISAQGSIVNLPGVVELTFLAGDLPVGQSVTISTTSDSKIALSFDVQGTLS